VAVTKSHWPNAKIVVPKKDAGFAEGNNIGIKAASGHYLMLLNNDTELEPDTVSQLVAVALKKPQAAAVVPKIFFYYLPSFINSLGNAVYPWGWGSDNYIGHLDIGQFNEEMELFSACFGAVLIPRPALAKVGLLDGRYRFYYEDADWSYRARLQGLKVYLAPQAVVYHKFNASMQSLTPYFKWQLVIGNRLRFVLKNLSVGTTVNFLRHYLMEDLRGAGRSLKYRDWLMLWAYLKAYGRVLLNAPNIFWQRWQIQRTRAVKDGQLLQVWPKLPALIDERGYPILDTTTVRRIYMHVWGPTFQEKGADVQKRSAPNVEAK
jgi:GT2 family glycosyltransferase